jgi:hypothetical protein
MASVSNTAAALEKAAQCLSSESSEAGCSLEVMESTFKMLSSETVRAECSPSQQVQIDDLWRLIKMMYNGSTRQEALAARDPNCIQCEGVAKAYGQVLRYLNPSSSDVGQCSLADLEAAYGTLGAAQPQSNFSQPQNQVIDQLLKAIQCVKDGHSVKLSVKKVWEDRDNAARSRLLHARDDFIGAYPSGGADAFAQALDFLSPNIPDECCPLVALEEAFRVLDSELVRCECSEAHQNVIDDLWRLIKMKYNGASRQEALAARKPDEIQDMSAAEVYGKVLHYLNPNSAECASCSLADLELAYGILSTKSLRSVFSVAQNQVIDQLEKAIQSAKGGNSIQVAIEKAWSTRDNAARQRFK